MSFDDNLRRALDPSEQLPRELHLGQRAYSWNNGKLEFKDYQPDFRTLTDDELRRLMLRLQDAPQDHVIFLNLGGHKMGDDMMPVMDDGMIREMAATIAALKALRALILTSTHSKP
jgi:hypothetical protein